VLVRNITLSLDEIVLATVRRDAAEKNATIKDASATKPGIAANCTIAKAFFDTNIPRYQPVQSTCEILTFPHHRIP
jgi:phage major head subunit gpT-like protein